MNIDLNNALCVKDYLISHHFFTNIPRVPVVNSETSFEMNKNDLKKIFISYATKDKDIFQIPTLAEKLSEQIDIEDVFFWEEHAIGSIINYMKEFLMKSDVVLIFWSPDKYQSTPMQMERNLTLREDKKFISIYLKLEDIDEIWQDFRGIKWDTENINKNIDEIMRLINVI